jgi:hypothetical protein
VSASIESRSSVSVARAFKTPTPDAFVAYLIRIDAQKVTQCKTNLLSAEKKCGTSDGVRLGKAGQRKSAVRLAYFLGSFFLASVLGLASSFFPFVSDELPFVGGAWEDLLA